MTKVYFVRHAKSDFSIKDDLTRPLVKEAINDCKKVTDFLSDKEDRTRWINQKYVMSLL